MISIKRLDSTSRLSIAVTMAVMLTGCSDPAGPVARHPQVDADASNSLVSSPASTGPSILRFRRGAPPLEQRSVSFYATKGKATSVSLYFKSAPSGRRSEYARLVIPSGALAQRPNGTSIGKGDSVLITVSAPDPALLLLRMEPHGLKFDARSPARLMMRYNEADPDFNGDGTVNVIDALIELRLSIWRQPTLLDLFTRLASILDRSAKSVSADLPGFSQYVIAY